jgi:hypothetical protein
MDPRKNLGESATIILAQKLDAYVAIDDYDGANLARVRELIAPCGTNDISPRFPANHGPNTDPICLLE